MKAVERAVLVGIVVAVALLIRVGYVATTYVKDPLRTDAGEYARYAHNLAHHGVYSLDEEPPLRADSFRSPGYPLFLAAAVAIGDEARGFAVARYVQVVLGAAMALLTFFLARGALPFWASLTAAALVAASPHLVTSTGYLLTETLLGFAILAGLVLLSRGVRRGSTVALAGAGAALGYAYLINESVLLLPFVLALVAWRRAGRKSGVAWFLALFCAFVAAWAVRNAVSLEPGARTGSERALITMSHGSYPGWVHEDPRYRYSAYLEDPEQPAFGGSWERFTTVWWRRFRERPGRYLAWYLLEKPYYLWSWDILQGQGDVYVFPVADSLYVTAPAAGATRAAMKLLHPLVLVLAAAGLLITAARTARRGRVPNLAIVGAVVTCGYFTALYTVFAPWPRYSVPLRPELYLTAVWAAVELIAWLRARARPTATLTVDLPPGAPADRPAEAVTSPAPSCRDTRT